MKKLIAILSVSLFIFASCGNNAQKNEEATATDSTTVSCCGDSTACTGACDSTTCTGACDSTACADKK